ncbi:MAG: RpiB/LacA/LacB family sugar-phosphate isomerase [bacterium]|nr:RpiB/LacA/LacB family sugar-phosphate isomerase [bacterium]
MKIYLASDHAGFEHKEAIKKFLEGQGYTVIDKGAASLDPKDDYPDFMKSAALAVVNDPGARAIIFGGSGQGEALVANRIRGVRAAVYYGGDEKIITLSREHGDANVLSIGARFVDIEHTEKMVTLWLATPFSNEERHRRRINKIDND